MREGFRPQQNSDSAARTERCPGSAPESSTALPTAGLTRRRAETLCLYYVNSFQASIALLFMPDDTPDCI